MNSFILENNQKTQIDNVNEDKDTNTNTNTDIDMKTIISRISKLSTKEKGHILNILKMANVEFTKNSNGYFFNFLDVKSDIIEKICDCLDLIEKNADILKEMDRRRTDLLKYYRKIIEERLQNNIIRKKNEYLNKLHVKQPSNITINVTRKPKFKKRVLIESSCEDPDEIIKQYIKSRTKYQKDSVYHRIITSIKFIKSNKARETKRDDDNSDSADILNKEDNSDYDMADNDNDSVHNFTDDNSVYEEVENPENEDDKTDEIKTDEKDENTNQNENEDDNEDDEDKGSICSEVVDQDSDDKTDIDFQYYKNILYKQGFEFDDNKNCLLVYQMYIE
jgi:hypothetical protein